ncbi:DUF1778 domain-containing protein [Vibrio breoganii]
MVIEVSEKELELLKIAAEIQGCTVEEFIINAAICEAQRVLSRHE